MEEYKLDCKFYRDELRCGFYIPTAIKLAWAASLRVLAEIDRICTKYKIEYFADWGTLIGIVRHGGFVPWDDDLDICMKREDYRRFREVADRELPREYVIHDYERQEDHWLFLARVCNSKHINYSKEHLNKYHNFPYISAIDIFIQDYVYRDSDKEKERCDSVKYLLAVADSIIRDELDDKTLDANLSEIESKYGVSFDRNSDSRDLGISLYKLIETRLGETPESEADNLVQMFPWGIKGARGLSKKYYEHIIRLPFENTTIPVPACYAKVLTDRYGDYLKVHKIWSGHGYPYFEGQKANLQAVANFKLPEFTFNKDMLRRPEVDLSTGVKAISGEWIEEIKAVHVEVEDLLNTEQFDDSVLAMLADCQQATVDFGSYVEQAMGADRESVKVVVNSLETYCETLFDLYNNPEDKTCFIRLTEAFNEVEEEVRDQIIDKNIIVFVVDDIARFGEVEQLYNSLVANRDNEVYKTYAQTCFKDIYGNIMDEGLISEEEWEHIDLVVLTPDIIYFQNPYDDQNPCLTLQNEFFASNMRKNTKKLIYIAPKVDEFDSDAINDVYNMKYYVTAPGVILADEVYVQSDNMKNMYIKKLTEFAGTDTESIWSAKIVARPEVFADKENHFVNEKKKILFCFGENELFEHDPNSLNKAIDERLGLFRKNNGSLDLAVCIYPNEIEKEQKDRFFGFDLVDFNEIESKDIGEYDAYYGSPSPLVLGFVRSGKPVMIANYEI